MENYWKYPVLILLMAMTGWCYAGQAEIVDARLVKQVSKWTAHVTIKHDDTGWEHYADGWRVVDDKGNILGHRTLYHPHVGEQLFTRSLSNIEIPLSLKHVYIEAHDKVHGWNPKKYKVALSR